jgi:hypothetical protein
LYIRDRRIANSRESDSFGIRLEGMLFKRISENAHEAIDAFGAAHDEQEKPEELAVAAQFDH